MKLNFIKALTSRKQEVKDAATAKDKQLKEVANRIADLNKQINEAAKRGDLNKYNELTSEKNMLEMKVKVMSKEDADGLTASEILSEWKKYAAEYNKEASKRLEAYTALKDHLARAYVDLVRMQNEALKQRETCRFETGTNYAFEGMEPIILFDALKEDLRAVEGFLSDRELENIRYIINGVPVDDLEEPTIYESIPKAAGVPFYEELEKRSRIVAEVLGGTRTYKGKDLSRLYWLSDEQKERLQNA